MKLKLEKIDEMNVLQVQEERIDAHNSAELKESILQFLEQGENKLFVQLSQVRFIDSSGLGALLSGYKNAVNRSGKLILCNVQPQVLAMFDLTRLNRVFEIYSDLNEAFAAQN